MYSKTHTIKRKLCKLGIRVRRKNALFNLFFLFVQKFKAQIRKISNSLFLNFPFVRVIRFITNKKYAFFCFY